MQHGIGIVAVLAVFGCATAHTQETFELVSITPDGRYGNGDSFEPAVSGDGRYVAFESRATDLVASASNVVSGVYVRDLDAGRTERVSLRNDSTPVDTASTGGGWIGFTEMPVAISHDGRFVAFMTADPNVVPGDSNGTDDLFLRDRAMGATTRISLRPDGGEFVGPCGAAQISADGNRVLFAHRTGSGSAMVRDWYVRDRAIGVTRLVSVVPDGSANRVDTIRLASGGRYVVFDSHEVVYRYAAGSYVRDFDAEVTTAVTPYSGWRAQSNPDWTARTDELVPLAISSNGQFILCWSFDDLDPTDGLDSSWRSNAWCLDRAAQTYRLVTRTVADPTQPWPADLQAFGGHAWVSDDGRLVRLRAVGGGMISPLYDDGDFLYEIDLETTETRVLSLDRRMQPCESVTSSYPRGYASSEDGRTVVYQAVFPGQGEHFRLWGSNGIREQLFARRVRGSAATTICAGDGSGSACPCGGVGLAGRGCANAFTPRGSVLRTRGNASLGDDTLTFMAYDTTFGASLLLQSSGAAPNGGVPFEGGVLCVSSPALRIGINVPWADDHGVMKIFGRGAWEALRMHELGGVWAPGTRYYQVWTRAVGGPSCIESRSSLTNGVRVEWRL